MTLLHYTCKSGAHGIGKYAVNLLIAQNICIRAGTSYVYASQNPWEGIAHDSIP